MLILTRKLGESVVIGDDIITVLTIHKNQIKLGINDSEVITISLRKSVSIRDGIKVTVVKIDKSQVKLDIEAPEDVTIYREEVLPFT